MTQKVLPLNEAAFKTAHRSALWRRRGSKAGGLICFQAPNPPERRCFPRNAFEDNLVHRHPLVCDPECDRVLRQERQRDGGAQKPSIPDRLWCLQSGSAGGAVCVPAPNHPPRAGVRRLNLSSFVRAHKTTCVSGPSCNGAHTTLHASRFGD